jgi:hypothetical protein
VQSVLNDGWLTLGNGHKMKLDVDPFLVNVNMINFEEKKILVRASQAGIIRGKNFITSDEPRRKMITPRHPELGVWKVNHRRWLGPIVKPTSEMLLEQYARWRWESVFQGLGSFKRSRSPEQDR